VPAVRVFWRRVPGGDLDALGFSGGYFALERLEQARLDILGNLLRLATFVDFESLLGGVDDDETVRTFGDVGLEAALHFGIAVRVEIIVQFLEELFTGKQRRLPLFA